MTEMKNFNFTVTGIGSVPFLDIKNTCVYICHLFSDAPFWPQLVKRSVYEDMIIQFSEGLPCLKIIKEKRSLIAKKGKNAEKELLKFYEHFLTDDFDYFSISYDFAPALYELVDIIKDRDGPFIKGQSVGPITFAASINDENGRSVINDPELLEAYTKGIAIKGLWQIKKLKESRRMPILFFDEPYLSAIGSAFSTISKEKVVEILREVIEYIKEKEDVIIGIHCCGNTDWSMIVDAGPDIISFDAFNYLDHFLLYKDKLVDFIKKGGSLAWGIVPTTDTDFERAGNIDQLLLKLNNGLKQIKEWGLDPELIPKNSILTPSCGMGTMGQENAKKAMKLLLDLSKRLS